MFQILNPSLGFCFKHEMIQNLKSEFRFCRLDCPFKRKLFRISIQNLKHSGFSDWIFLWKFYSTKKYLKRYLHQKKCQQTFLPKNLRKETVRKKNYQINFEEKVRPKNLWRESIYPSNFEERSVPKKSLQLLYLWLGWNKGRSNLLSRPLHFRGLLNKDINRYLLIRR